MRKTSEELQNIMEQENCDRIWSWSKINCFHTSPFEYMLKYIKHIPEDRQDCIYTTTGTICHDILEKLYTGQIKYEDMAEQFEDGWLVAYNISQLKFDRNDEEKNKKIGSKYYENLKHFFDNHTMLEHKPMIEQFVKAKIGDNLFFGYIDCVFKDNDNNFNIVDFKSSSIYKGDTLTEKSGQLCVYAMGLNQAGVPFDKIKICFNFLKYCTIQYEQKNGAIKTRDVERNKIGESLQSNVKIWLKEFGYGDQIDDYLKMLLDANSIKVLPEEVQKKYKIYDCYVYIPLTQKLIDNWINIITTTIEDISLREEDYKETESELCFWDSDESVEKNSYYFATLSGYSGKLHKPYKAYLDKLEEMKDGTDMFNGIGSNTENEVISTKPINNNKNSAEVDLSWLDSLS